jgi:hypothetical protein
LLLYGGYFVRHVPTLALHGINDNSARNYHLINKESTRGKVIPLGITRSCTRNPPKECLFRWELPAHRRGYTRGRGFRWAETSSSFTRIQAIMVRSECAENPPNSNNSRISSSKSSILTMAKFLKFKCENLIKLKNKPDPAILGTSYPSNYIKKGQQNLMSINF